MKDELAAIKRERTISAAVELFYERGYENTTLEAVGEFLGGSKQFVYSQFSTKADLLAEICGRGIRFPLQAMDEAIAKKEPPTRLLKSLSESFVKSILENQKSIAIFVREEKHLTAADFDRITAMRRDFDRKLLAVLDAGRKSGEFKLRDPAVAALAIGGLVSWSYVWYRPNGRLTIRDLADELTALIMAMVGAR